ncbi:MAG: VOC family protein [Phycicoccus sp.]
MDQRLSFVTVAVDDLDIARRFYVDALGWLPDLDVPGEVLMLAVGDRVVLSLWARASFLAEVGGSGLWDHTELAAARAPGLLPVTLAHNVATPEAVDTVIDRAHAAGARVAAAVRREWGGYSG